MFPTISSPRKIHGATPTRDFSASGFRLRSSRSRMQGAGNHEGWNQGSRCRVFVQRSTALRGGQNVTHSMDVQIVSGCMAALIDTSRPCDGQCTPSAVVPLRVDVQVPGDHVVPGVQMHQCPCEVDSHHCRQRHRGTGEQCCKR